MPKKLSPTAYEAFRAERLRAYNAEKAKRLYDPRTKVLASDLKSEEVAGFIFRCNAETRQPSIEGMIFGLPAAHTESVMKIRVGTPIFLFDDSARVLVGCFRAVQVQSNIDQKLFQPGRRNTLFTAQARVELLHDNLHELSVEQVFRVVTLHSGGSFFNELDARQTQLLVKMFGH